MVKLLRNINPPKSKMLPNTAYYYFSRLNSEQKDVYNTMLVGIKAHAREIKLLPRPMNEMALIFNAVLLDNPMIFHVQSFSVTSDLLGKQVFIPNYKCSKQEFKKKAAIVKESLRVFDVVKSKSDLDKELFVHDYCLDNFTYDYTFGEHAYSVLGVVLNKTAVCEGIAKFVKLSFDYLSVKSLVVTGKADNPAQDSATEAHAWNIVKLDGKTYHLDITFDMTLKGKQNRYDYFNLCDKDIKKDHVIIGDVPVCVTVGGDYFTANSLLANGFSELGNIIVRERNRGKKSVMVKITGMRYSESVLKKVMDIAQKKGTGIFGGAIEVSYNVAQMVFEINFK